MDLRLAASGTVTECREALNAKLAELPVPETQENKVVRMIAHYIVADYLDPLHDEWQRQFQQIRAANAPSANGGLNATMAEPPEPKAVFAIDCSITLGDAPADVSVASTIGLGRVR
jgi:hypothetical protein